MLPRHRAVAHSPKRVPLLSVQVRYTRCNNNPSQVILGQKIAELEGMSSLCLVCEGADNSSLTWNIEAGVTTCAAVFLCCHLLQAQKTLCRWQVAWQPSPAPC